jgi:hypothetical protein
VKLQFGAPKEVAATDDDGDLDTGPDDLGNLACQAGNNVWIDADLPATEDLSGQLEQYSLVRTGHGTSGDG